MDVGTLWNTYTQLVFLRETADNVARSLPGVQFFVSCLTATTSGKSGQVVGKQRLIYPGVSYWIAVKDSPDRGYSRSIYSTMKEQVQGGSLKLLLQPIQQSTQEVTNSLYATLKDNNMGSCVRKLINTNPVEAASPVPHSMAQLHCVSVKPQPWMHNAVQQLEMCRFHMDIKS